MGYAKYVGRVGALALALGIGTAVATPAWAEAPSGSDSTSSASESSQKPSSRRSTTATSGDSASSGDSAGSSGSDDSTTPAAGNDNDAAVEDEADIEVAPEPGAAEDAPPLVVEVVEESDAPASDSASAASEVDTPSAAVQSDDTGASAPDAPADETPASTPPDRDPEPAGAELSVSPTPLSYALAVTPPPVKPAPAPLVRQPQGPVAVILGGPAAMLDIAARALHMLFNPGPTVPGDPPVLLAVLAFVRREIQRTFFNSSPTAVADSTSTSEGLPTRISVLDNDIDPKIGDVLTVTDFTQAANGVVELNADGSFTYIPTAGFSGTDTFTYTISDEASEWHGHVAGLVRGHTSTATVSVTVLAAPVNQSPSAADDSAITAEDTPTVIDVKGNDSDPDGDAIAIASVGTAQHGTVAVLDGRITYTPELNFHGTDTFEYTITDGELTDTATVTVTVTPVNDAPVAVSDTAIVAGDSVANVIEVLGNDTDPDTSDNLTVTGLGTPSHSGTATIVDGRTISYTPAAGFSGTETFSYTVSDGTATAAGTVTVTVTPVAQVNTPPVAVNDSYTMTPGATSATVNVVANDTDPDSDTLTVTAVTGATNGTTRFTGGTITYTPTTGYAGTETLTYTVTDGKATDTATLTITVPAVTPVNTPPVAVNDVASTTKNTAVVIDVMANDIDPDEDTLTISGVTDPTHGTAAIADGKITYTPNNGFAGTDTFTYTITDETATHYAQVTVSVLGLLPTAPRVTPVGLVTTVDATGIERLFGLYGIASAPDGTMLVTGEDELGNYFLGSVAADGSITKLADLPGTSYDVEVGPDGHIYVAGGVTRTVIAVDPATLATREIARFTDNPIGLAFDDEGTLYVTTLDLDGYAPSTSTGSLVILKTDGTTETVVLPGISADVHVGPDGRVYVTYYSFSSESVTPADAGVLIRNSDGTHEYVTPPGIAAPSGIAVGSDGTMFIGDALIGVIVHYPNGITRSLGSNFNTFGIAFGHDGLVYITNTGSNTITKLDPFYNPSNSSAPVILDSEWYDTNDGGQVGFVDAEDADGDVLTYTVVSEIDPAIGSVEMMHPSYGQWLFTPTAQARADAWEAWNDPAAENLTVTFTVVASDGELTDSVTITVEISPYAPLEIGDPAYSIDAVDDETGYVSGQIHVASPAENVRFSASDFDWGAGSLYVDYVTGTWQFWPSTESRNTALETPYADEFEFVIIASDGTTDIPVMVRVPIVPAAPSAQLQRYTTFDGYSLDLFKYSGERVLLLADSATLDQATVQKWLDALDGAYDFFKLATGKEPMYLTPTFIDGLATIARVPSSTCGWVCAHWGATGIEIEGPSFDYMYQRLLEYGDFYETPFFELGRNFWIHDKIDYLDAPYDPVSSGFAVFMRSMSIEYLDLNAAPFMGVSFSEFEDQVRSLREIYLADPSLNWANTLGVAQGVPFPQNPVLGPTDLFASFCFYLRDTYGMQWVENVWKFAGERPDRVTTQDAVDNFIIAASQAANTNLVPLFEHWRWPVSQNAIGEIEALNFATSWNPSDDSDFEL